MVKDLKRVTVFTAKHFKPNEGLPKTEDAGAKALKL